ncbi:unnamed protein product [Albugo candida]|uniref:Uncharacterized protein n=1 Tax=Albugo candida TaxID=65357 RepID=A0A024GEC1_9STRA|nr:unnamed protein product [Albugo candida]|eukprot:CCI45224.1 unnamed protein product [Albugo candida]
MRILPYVLCHTHFAENANLLSASKPRFSQVDARLTRPALKTKALRFHLSQKEPFMEVSIPARFSTPHVTQIPRSGSRDCACRYKCNSSSSRKFNNWIIYIRLKINM